MQYPLYPKSKYSIAELRDSRFSTQNALEKFLKKLLMAGIHNIISVGGSSKSPTIKAKDFKAVASSSIKPHRERRQIFESHRDLETLQPKLNSLLRDLFRYVYSWGPRG